MLQYNDPFKEVRAANDRSRLLRDGWRLSEIKEATKDIPKEQQSNALSELVNCEGREIEYKIYAGFKVVSIMNPADCLHCNQIERELVEHPSGRQERKFRCRRRDCDNWIR